MVDFRYSNAGGHHIGRSQHWRLAAGKTALTIPQHCSVDASVDAVRR